MNRFAGRRALVTGAGAGIGSAVAERLGGEGAEVIVADIDPASARAVAAACGGRPLTLDVSDSSAVASVLAQMEPVDVLVNNAGIDDFGWFTETDAERWRRVLAVNLEGAMACTRAVLPAMQVARYGRVVMVSSEAARIGSSGNAPYAASKAGMIALARSLARENAKYGITVNAVTPGPVATPMLDRNRSSEHGERLISAMTAATMLRRLGDPAEIAAAVAFLASQEASFVTGEVLGVSGGMGSGG